MFVFHLTLLVVQVNLQIFAELGSQAIVVRETYKHVRIVMGNYVIICRGLVIIIALLNLLHVFQVAGASQLVVEVRSAEVQEMVVEEVIVVEVVQQDILVQEGVVLLEFV